MQGHTVKNAGIAQLVERNLAKVEVASSSLVSRSKFKKGSSASLFCQRFRSVLCAPDTDGAIAKRLCPGLQIRLVRFDSGSRLHLLTVQTVLSLRHAGFFSSVPFMQSRLTALRGAVYKAVDCAGFAAALRLDFSPATVPKLVDKYRDKCGVPQPAWLCTACSSNGQPLA